MLEHFINIRFNNREPSLSPAAVIKTARGSARGLIQRGATSLPDVTSLMSVAISQECGYLLHLFIQIGGPFLQQSSLISAVHAEK